jgi:hypothetical protein
LKTAFRNAFGKATVIEFGVIVVFSIIFI